MPAASARTLLSLLLLLLPVMPLFSALPLQAALPRKLALVPTPATVLSYHGGPLLTRRIKLYLLWYGSFTPAQKAILSDFASSISAAAPARPSVSAWWSIAASYSNAAGGRVSSSVFLAGEAAVLAPHPPKPLSRAALLALLLSSLSSNSLPVDADGLYFVLTAADVPVEDFCMSSCGFHAATPPSPATRNKNLTYGWVGNPGTQCPGFCAWPYALPEFGPQTPPLISPNKDVGMEGMVMNMAVVLAGAATNPFGTGFYEGDALAPLEAASACAGEFGKGSYPGYPGAVLTAKKSGASYNAHGVDGRLYLLPALWSPATHTCTPVS